MESIKPTTYKHTRKRKTDGQNERRVVKQTDRQTAKQTETVREKIERSGEREKERDLQNKEEKKSVVGSWEFRFTNHFQPNQSIIIRSLILTSLV